MSSVDIVEVIIDDGGPDIVEVVDMGLTGPVGPNLVSATTQSTLGNGIVASDNGELRLATNAEVVSEAELSAAIAVLQNLRPVITTQPTSQSGNAGSAITLSCLGATIANTHLSLSYQWQFSLDGATWGNIVGATSATYSIASLTVSDVGNYRCQISNQFGTQSTNVVTVTLLAVPEITAQPSDATVPSGTAVTFSVSATGGALTYQWQRNLGTGLGWSNIPGANSPTFTTPALTASERKHAWRCRVHNVRGRIMSRVCTVAIRAAATTYYVDNVSGNDANPGTESQPFQTITQAISMGTAVNILLRRGQTFSGAVTLNAQALGAYGSGAAPILTHTSGATLQSTGSCLIEDIEVRNSDAASLVATVSVVGSSRVRRCTLLSNGNKSITVSAATDAIVENCTLTDSMNCAQLATLFQSANCVFRSNTVTRTQSQTQIGVFVHGAGSQGHVIEDNTITTAVGDTSAAVTQGISINQDYTYVTDIIIRGNTVRGTGWDRGIVINRGATAISNIVDLRGSILNNIPIEVNRGATGTLRNNTIVIDGNTIQVIVSNNTSAASNVVTQNNIVFFTGGSNFYTAISGSATFTADRNIYFGSSRAGAWNSLTWANWQASGRDVNGLNTNPLFINLAANDYRIQAASPARNAGQDFDYELDHFGWEYNVTTPSMGALAYWEAVS